MLRLMGCITVLLLSISLAGNASCQPNSEDVSSKQIDPITLGLYRQYILPQRKGGTELIECAIRLIVDREAGAPEFQDLLRKDFVTILTTKDQRYDSRNLTLLITAILRSEGATRWSAVTYRQESFMDPLRQAAPPFVSEFLKNDSKLLEELINYGQKRKNHEIGDIAFAVQQAYHPQGKEFLLKVLHNSNSNQPFVFGNSSEDAKESRTKDNKDDVTIAPLVSHSRGDRTEAHFYSAVGLAELGVEDGVQWLIKHSAPNDFGIDGTIRSHSHFECRTDSLRANCNAVLLDLSGLEAKEDGSQHSWSKWWLENSKSYKPKRRAMLKP